MSVSPQVERITDWRERLRRRCGNILIYWCNLLFLKREKIHDTEDGKKQILIVEDNELNRMILSEILSDPG